MASGHPIRNISISQTSDGAGAPTAVTSFVPRRKLRRTGMLDRILIGTFALLAALALTIASATAQDLSKYPDWSGIWRGDHGFQWDPTKRPGIAQQAPLTPEYQKIFEDSLKGQEEGSQGNNVRFTCMPSGMPRTMTGLFQIEFVITPATTF